ncbi:MAG: SH3 domain-containing protein [Clostridia bacterium]|nr:SH3 domain-containing protein [Clostridia bacterium]
MLKKAISLLICLVVLLGTMPLCVSETRVEAEEYSFGDRILFGGTAVDVNGGIAFSENQKLYFRFENGDTAVIADLGAKYLNYCKNMLWFVSGNAIMQCYPNGSALCEVKSFESEPKCLYVLEDKLLYLLGNTVFSLCGDEETALLTREGIAGFVPESENTVRWAKNNPDYKYIEETGDEIWEEGVSEFVFFDAEIGSEPESDVASGAGEAVAAAASNYTGPYVQVGKVTLPLSEHMPGTYFSKNGKACTCHNTSSNYCIQSVGNCNCMRYYPTGKSSTCEIDLLGAQCFAFARMVFWKCFGFIDHSTNSSLYYSVGSLSRGAVTANSVKALLTKAATGAHVRLAAGHSVSILTMSDDFIVIYHGNAGGDGVSSSPCIVSTRRYTWAQFANAASAGILYVNMPYDYPDSSEILTEKEVGYYKLTANLNLRAGSNTQTASLGVIPKGTVIEVTETTDYWGKTSYKGTEGWVFLEYTTFYSRKAIAPSGEVFVRNENGYICAAAWKTTLGSFSEYFDKQSISVVLPSGEEAVEDTVITTGTLVSLNVNGKTVDSALVCLAGDTNQNGILDIGDYLIVRRAVLGSFELSEAAKIAADVNASKSVDAHDYMLIKRYFLSNDSSLFEGFAS